MKNLVELILENRSLVENSPLNLLKFDEAKKYYLSIGEKAFINQVNSILDLYE